MLRAILVDDEPLALKSLENDLKDYCQDTVLIIDTCLSPIQALSSIRKLKPDLVFLDVKMAGYEIDGFGILEILGQIDFSIIFVTAYADYALKALKLSATDYLLKDYLPEELVAAVMKVLDNQNSVPFLEIKKLFENYQGMLKDSYHQVSFQVEEGVILLDLQNIMYCLAEGAYTRFYLEEGMPVIVCKNMKAVSAKLPSKLFYRIHHSHLINKQYLKKILTGGSKPEVLLKDGKTLAISRNRKKEFLSWIEDRNS